MSFVIPDVLLHGFDIWLVRNIADIFGNKSLDIHNGTERYCLFQHPADLLIVDVPLGQHIGTVLLVAVVHFLVQTVLLFQVDAKTGNIHGLLFIQEAASWDTSVVNKKALLPASVAAAVEDDSGHKVPARLLVQKLTDNIAGKVFTPPGIGGVVVHVGPQVSVQRPLGFLIGSLIEISGVRLAQKDDLQRVDHSGLSRSVFPGQEIDILHLNQLLREIEPVNQQNLLQLLHRPPPFSAPIPPCPTSRWIPPTILWVKSQIYSCSGCIFPRSAG